MTDTNNDDMLDNGVVADSEPEPETNNGISDEENERLDGDDVVDPPSMNEPFRFQWIS